MSDFVILESKELDYNTTINMTNPLFRYLKAYAGPHAFICPTATPAFPLRQLRSVKGKADPVTPRSFMETSCHSRVLSVVHLKVSIRRLMQLAAAGTVGRPMEAYGEAWGRAHRAAPDGAWGVK